MIERKEHLSRATCGNSRASLEYPRGAPRRCKVPSRPEGFVLACTSSNFAFDGRTAPALEEERAILLRRDDSRGRRPKTGRHVGGSSVFQQRTTGRAALSRSTPSRKRARMEEEEGLCRKLCRGFVALEGDASNPAVALSTHLDSSRRLLGAHGNTTNRDTKYYID
ncbi:hypothetical protein KM043_015310 [Ampulex compressa]|nr:hypothetical protein KM043_015310 [Ampulex compressa]